MATGSRKDDDKDRHMPVHNGGGDTLRRIEVITGTGRRRRWDAETKGRLVAESFEPGCSVSEVARRHDISPGLLFLWRRQAAEATKDAGSNPLRRGLLSRASIGDRQTRTGLCQHSNQSLSPHAKSGGKKFGEARDRGGVFRDIGRFRAAETVLSRVSGAKTTES